MPSGTKKRKASKKKTKKEEAQDSSDQQSSSSSTHFHGSEDPKSFDERESDGGEFEREEEEEKEEEVVNQQEDDVVKDKGVEEEVVRVEMEEKLHENGSESADLSAVNVEKETHSVPGNGAVEDKEVAVVEEEKSMIAELGKLKGHGASSALESVPGGEEAVGVEGASVEEFQGSVEVRIPDVELVKEVSAGVSDVVDSGLMKNMDSVSQMSDDKEKFSSAIEDRQPEKVETEVASIDEDKYLDSPAVNTSSGMDAVETLETGKQLEEQVVTSATTQVVDSVKNGETHMQSNDQVVATVANTSREVDNGKDLETQKHREEQPSIGSNPLSIRRTSWKGCCGLFEVFSGANR